MPHRESDPPRPITGVHARADAPANDNALPHVARANVIVAILADDLDAAAADASPDIARVMRCAAPDARRVQRALALALRDLASAR
jgi:hypothetical protein